MYTIQSKFSIQVLSFFGSGWQPNDGACWTSILIVHLFVLLIQHLLYLVYEIFSIKGHEVRNLLHQVHYKGQRQTFTVYYLLLIVCLGLFKVLECIIIGVVEVEVYPSLLFLFWSVDLYIRKRIWQRLQSHTGTLFLFRKHHHHNFGDFQLASFKSPSPFHIHMLQVEIIDVELGIAWEKLIFI